MMTSDRVTNALVSILDGAKPHSSITVTDAQELETISLPSLAVTVTSNEPHSLSLPGVQKMTLEIKLRCHIGDTATKADVEGWCDTVERTLNDPAIVPQLINVSGNQVWVDRAQCHGGQNAFEDSVLATTWQMEVWAQRAG